MQVRQGSNSRAFRTVTYDGHRNAVRLIDQRLLPHRFTLFESKDFQTTAWAIREMVVRGAGAIGAAAAYGLAQGLADFHDRSLARFERRAARVFAALAGARPTAVDPVNAMRKVLSATQPGRTVAEKQALATAAAEQFAQEDVEHCRAIGRYGDGLIRDGMNILTHCNAGWLAFVDVGSATAPLYAAQASGKRFHVYCDETRPRCQGSTLTAWELDGQGISHQIIADNAAGFLMERGMIDLVIVGSDRTLGLTGEVANKIGTYTKAVLAKRHKIPFYVAIPLSTIDWDMKSGRDIPIEERAHEEVAGAWGADRKGKRTYVRVANPRSSVFNPGFDVTPADLVTGIITPAGIFKPRDLWRHRRKLAY